MLLVFRKRFVVFGGERARPLNGGGWHEEELAKRYAEN